MILVGLSAAPGRRRASRSTRSSTSTSSASWVTVRDRQHPDLHRDGCAQCGRDLSARRHGTIATTFTFRKDGFDGEQKTYTPRGFVRDDGSNAVWGMRFVWPVKADYRIVWLDESYSQTVIGRNQRDYVWIMAREPAIPDADYRKIVAFLGEQATTPRRSEGPAAVGLTQSLDFAGNRWSG